MLGRDCWRDSARIKRDVGYLPGDLRLPSWLTFRSGVRIASLARGVDLAGAAGGLAERLDLDTDVRVRAMSRGMRQKLGLILALAHAPRVLVLDEPTASLDPIVQETLAQILRERADAGAAVFFSSHTLSEVERLCDRVAIVREGRIVADESIERLRARARRIVTLFFGSIEEAQRFEAPAFLKVDRREGARIWCELHAGAHDLIAWLPSQPVRDVEISPPNLERLFQRYYRDGRGDGGAGSERTPEGGA
jgi:ABC-2 type transport system ATP-binding protein